MTIRQLIKASGYRNDYVSEKLALTPFNFAAKIKGNKFSVEEVKKIILIIKNEKVEDCLMLEVMRARKNDPTISLEQLEKEMKW